MTGLDASEVAQLADEVPRERPPSKLYQGAWDKIEEARNLHRLELTDEDDKKEGLVPMKTWAGFARSTWFVYKAKGTIPLDVFHRLLTRLGLRYALAVRPIRGYSKAPTSAPEVVVVSDTEEARAAADLINRYDEPTRKDLLIALQNKALVLTSPPRPPIPAVVVPDNGR